MFNAEILVSIFALIISLGAFVAAMISSVYARRSYQDNVYEIFFKMWFTMDQIFIEYPHMHKYFYDNIMPDPATQKEDYELGICIAEQFREVFQYSAPLADQLPEYYYDYVRSYEDYMARISSTSIYREADKKNPIQFSKQHRIGLRDSKKQRRRLRRMR